MYCYIYESSRILLEAEIPKAGKRARKRERDRR